MKKELKDKWVAALRSGKYEQGQNYLRTEKNKYCCLGVLCEVAGIEPVLLKDGYHYGTDNADLDNDLMNKFGLNRDHIYNLIQMNDDDEESFEAIANYIESDLCFQ